MELYDFKNLVEAFSHPKKIKSICNIQPGDQDLIIIVQALDERGYIKAHTRKEIRQEQIKSLDPVESMYLVKNIINSLDKIKL